MASIISLINIISLIKSHKTVFALLLVIVLQLLPNAGFLPWGGIWMRFLPKEMVHADSIARQEVSNEIFASIEKQMAEKFPQKTAVERDALARRELNARYQSLPLIVNKKIQERRNRRE